MSARIMPSATPIDIPSTFRERNEIDDSYDSYESLLNGEGHGLIDRQQNGAVNHSISPGSNGKRTAFSRSLSVNKFMFNENVDLEDGKMEKDRDKSSRRHGLKVPNQALLSGFAYCISSCSMILVNKFVLSSYNFNAGIFLMMYQVTIWLYFCSCSVDAHFRMDTYNNLVCVIIVSLSSFFGFISTEPLTLPLIKVWLPVNVIFVGMLLTSIFSLKYINVAMVTVLKNVTNVITAVGEMYLFSKHHDNKVWASLLLMIVSAISGGITDLTFHAVGYAWQIVNCFLTASYSLEILLGSGLMRAANALLPLLMQLTLRRVMDTAKQVTKSGNLNEFSMVLLNNFLSLPLGALLIVAFNEMDYLVKTPLMRLPTFWLVMTASGLLGLAISFTSMWFLHQTGPTTYSLVGSLNKIPLSLAGIGLFHVPTTLQNSLSILFGLIAGVFFAKAKMNKTRS